MYEVEELQRVHESSLKTKWILQAMQDKIKQRNDSTKTLKDYKRVESNQQQLRINRETQMKTATENDVGKKIPEQIHERISNESDWDNKALKDNENEEEAQHVIVNNDGSKNQDIDPVSEVTNVQPLALLQEDENKRPFKL